MVKETMAPFCFPFGRAGRAAISVLEAPRSGLPRVDESWSNGPESVGFSRNRNAMARRIVDLSIAIENEIVSDPPGCSPIVACA
jgi:hypothetical protein